MFEYLLYSRGKCQPNVNQQVHISPPNGLLRCPGPERKKAYTIIIYSLYNYETVLVICSSYDTLLVILSSYDTLLVNHSTTYDTYDNSNCNTRCLCS